MPLVNTPRAAPSRDRLIRAYLWQGASGLALMAIVTFIRFDEVSRVVAALGPQAWLLVLLLYLFATTLAVLKFRLTEEIFVSLSVTAFIASIPLLGVVLSSWLTVLSSLTARSMAMAGIGPTRISMDDPVQERVRLFGLFSTYGIPSVVAAIVYEQLGGSSPLRAASLEAAWQIAVAGVVFILVNVLVMKPIQAALGYPFRGSYKLDLVDASIYIAGFPYSILVPYCWVALGFRGVIPLLFTGVVGTMMVRKFADARSNNAELVKRLASLSNVAAAVSINCSREELLKAIYDECRKVMDTSLFTIALYDAERNELRFELDLSDGQPLPLSTAPVSDGLNSWVVQNRRSLLIRSSREEREKGLHAIDDGLSTESWLGAPMIMQDRIIGVISVQSFKKDAFTEDDRLLLTAVASQAAAAIEDTTLYQNLEQRVVERTNELHEANLRLKEADRAKTQFLANMSHELRTPLNSIIGFSTILREKAAGAIAPRLRAFLDNIHTSGTHLLSLINDILDLAKVESGRLELQVDCFDLRETIASVERVMKGVAADHEVMIATSLDPRISTVTMDEGRVKQILINLLSNAVKFSPRGEYVRLSVRKIAADASPLQAETVRFTVEDHGIGIPSAALSRIFEEFYQVEQSRASGTPGTGLGLPLSKRFAELLGGTIEVSSTEGEGSTFTVDLPIDVTTSQRQPLQMGAGGMRGS